ncbi:ABC transporter permease subunit [Mesorhizobium sp. M2A.F.Ca.ET.043.02.1.1]|uniref:ABC transporter permease n=1 Tax=unclassified Mesorhizobium TaxID=325217 RepID=UPI000F74EFFB|nr:ABC transporter permease subunit [Mesorhizobium sp. M2A.F.Ca.ET.043.02.1.1]AZO03844.1 ABC transporter permease subunit [Mesorhizobium sp. M2A.F.Ca.ET.043.02.1.1]RWB52957.1 MAG: ABC transporter permease subunit [Mesorhizobium sp.]TJW83672.1 MAG: ABC transporter permease subunit [Mesorhizobium sp.]
MGTCGLLDPFECGAIPVADWMTIGLRWIVDHYRPLFQSIKVPFDLLLQWFGLALHSVPPVVMIIVAGLAAWQFGGRNVAGVIVGALIFMGLIGVWQDAMTTLSIVLTSLVVAVMLGIPLGIWAARSERMFVVMRPILDGMQTIPAFVYLVPIVMLFGIGNVPGVIVTVIFAVAPLIRLTNLGIRQVPEEVIEAMRAFGATERQLLWKAQLPLALPTIMAGINQTLMMSLSMVVIGSMIAVGGLGQTVLRGIGRLDVGLATVGGLGIVALAIVLDRLTHALATQKRRPGELWHQGPVGLVRALTGNKQR